MTPEQISLIRESWHRITPMADAAASLFYQRLFELDPTLRPLFPADLSQQRRKLLHILTVVVKNLDELKPLIPTIQELGRRHVGYGARDRHYATVGAALLWALRQGLGEDFGDEAREAWTAAYGVLSSTMCEAARVAPPQDA